MTHRRAVPRHRAGGRRRLAITFLSLLLLLSPATARTQPTASAVTIASSAEAVQRRQALIEYLWGTTALPTRLPDVTQDVPSPLGALPNLRRVDELRVNMDAGVKGMAYHFVPELPNGRLVIVHNGHTCTLEGAGLESMISELLNARFAVLAMFMPRVAPNDCKESPHDPLFQDPALAPAAGSPMRYFLEPVAASINYLLSRSQVGQFPLYREIDMLGHSGGGWTTTLYAAIDPRIRLSFPVAGSIPISSRGAGSVGDAEQYFEDFYRIAGYRDLYLLGAREPGRKQFWILNRNDPCCFGDSEIQFRDAAGRSWDEAMRGYEAEVTGALGGLGRTGSFQLVIDDTSGMHSLSPHVIQHILAELARSQRARPAGAAAR